MEGPAAKTARHATRYRGAALMAAHSRMRLSAAFAIILSAMIMTLLLLVSGAAPNGPDLMTGAGPSIMQLVFLVGTIEVAMTILYIGIVNRLEAQAAAEAASL